jgi:hypothetical protein
MQERLVKLGLQENEIKEHISRYNVLQMHLTALQKKEAELSEKMEKQTAEHVSQEKVPRRQSKLWLSLLVVVTPHLLLLRCTRMPWRPSRRRTNSCASRSGPLGRTFGTSVREIECIPSRK